MGIIASKKMSTAPSCPARRGGGGGGHLVLPLEPAHSINPAQTSGIQLMNQAHQYAKHG